MVETAWDVDGEECDIADEFDDDDDEENSDQRLAEVQVEPEREVQNQRELERQWL